MHESSLLNPIAPVPAAEALEGAAAPSTPAIIRVAGLGKRFKIYPRPWGRVAEWLTGGRAVRHEDFWALRDVSFDMRKGESLGVIGVNGSGKSTLLKLLSGAMYPTEGTFEVGGRVLSLLELGTGVNPQLTGRQNVINSARLLAFPPGYVADKLGDIEAFAELAEFFDRPVRLYSSGMLVRLVFSMFACFEPDVFVVDEALSVGDLYFQQKCARRIQEMKRAGVTMLFVSHDLAAVEALCDRVLVLHGGRSRFLGDKRRGIQAYYAVAGAAAKPQDPAAAPADAAAAAGAGASDARQDVDLLAGADQLPWQPPDLAERGGDGRVDVTGVCYRRADDGAYTQVLEQGQSVDVFVRYLARADVGPCNGGVMVYDRLDQLLFGAGWVNAGLAPLWLKAGQEAVSVFRLRADLEPGEYVLWLGMGEPLPDPRGPHGWSQHVGSARMVSLPRGGKIAVLPRRDNWRGSFGPANLPYATQRAVVDKPGGRP